MRKVNSPLPRSDQAFTRRPKPVNPSERFPLGFPTPETFGRIVNVFGPASLEARKQFRRAAPKEPGVAGESFDRLVERRVPEDPKKSATGRSATKDTRGVRNERDVTKDAL
jgi:hypothetical protein